MPQPDKYLERASAAQINASHAATEKLRREFLSMARAWRGLAIYAERTKARLAEADALDSDEANRPL